MVFLDVPIVYLVKEILAYSRCDTFTLWLVEPYNVPLATFVFAFPVICAWGVVN